MGLQSHSSRRLCPCRQFEEAGLEHTAPLRPLFRSRTIRLSTRCREGCTIDIDQGVAAMRGSVDGARNHSLHGTRFLDYQNGLGWPATRSTMP